MRRSAKTLLASCILATAASSANAHDIQAAYASSFTNFLYQLNYTANNVWPGLTVSNTPLILAFTESKDKNNSSIDDRLYAFNASIANTAWQKININNTTVYTLPHDTIGVHAFTWKPTNAFFSLDNKKAIIFNAYITHTNTEDDFATIHPQAALQYYLAHEINLPNGINKFSLTESAHQIHSAFDDAAAMSLLALEILILNDYFKSNDPDILKDYVSIFETRNEMLDHNAALYEQSKYGSLCPEYVLLKFNLRTPTLRALQQKHASLLNNLIPTNADFDTESQYEDAIDFRQTAIAIALDNIYPNWKTSIDDTNLTTSLFLRNFLDLTSIEMIYRETRVKSRYHYLDIYNRYSSILAQRLQAIKSLQTVYNQSNNIEFIFADSQTCSLLSNIANYKRYSIDSHTKIANAIAPADDTYSIQTSDYSFESKNIPIIFEQQIYANDHWQRNEVKFKLPPDAKLTFDNNITSTVAEFGAKNQQRDFNTLEVSMGNSNSLQFKLKMLKNAGTLMALNGQLKCH